MLSLSLKKQPRQLQQHTLMFFFYMYMLTGILDTQRWKLGQVVVAYSNLLGKACKQKWCWSSSFSYSDNNKILYQLLAVVLALLIASNSNSCITPSDIIDSPAVTVSIYCIYLLKTKSNSQRCQCEMCKIIIIIITGDLSWWMLPSPNDAVIDSSPPILP